MAVQPIEEVEPVEEIDPEFNLLVDIASAEPEFEEEIIETDFVEDADREFDAPETEEDQERHKEHIRRKKGDKIFNNSYNTGEGYSNDEYTYNSTIRISPNHRDSHLHDPQCYRDHLDHSVTQEDILLFIEGSKEIQDVMAIDPSRKKYSKQELNFLFGKIKQGLERGFAKSSFISYIYILDAISSITTLEYRKIFDVLEYDYKEVLLLELDQKFNILGQTHKSKKLF